MPAECPVLPIIDRRLKLTRTQTIMGGASHCDFRSRGVDEAGNAQQANLT